MNFIEPKTYSVHDEKQIKGFHFNFRFLSNFWPADVYFQGERYHSAECAYQAAKIIPEQRDVFKFISAAESKKTWKTLTRIDDTKELWENRRYEVMATILFSKFLINKDLRHKLLETGEKYLEETNAHFDKFWGVDFRSGKGENNLGVLLMKTREFWR